MNYDIIGDIHGHADQLEELLKKMGYELKNGLYTHNEKRQVIFVGDFIDRGPKIRETLGIVKGMCDQGTALAVMGNHEWNAICFHTPHVERGGFLRDHTITEIEQHLETLRQFKNNKSEWEVYQEWFKTLPLFLDLPELRVVHACWDEDHINWLRKNYKGINKEFLAEACDKQKKGRVYTIVEETLKGKEQSLPDGLSITDKDGAVRTECRVKWWQPLDKRKTFKDVLLHCPDELAHKNIKADEPFYAYTGEKPVFFGHYWLKGEPTIENEKAICLDYSVAKGGELVAARVDAKAEVILMTA